MTGLGDLEQVIARLESATAEAREVTRELHSAIKAARGVEKGLTDAAAKVEADVPRLVDETIGKAIEDGLAQYATELRGAIARSTDMIRKTFERHVNFCLYGNEHGKGVSVLDEIRVMLEAGRDALDLKNAALPRLQRRRGM